MYSEMFLLAAENKSNCVLFGQKSTMARRMHLAAQGKKGAHAMKKQILKLAKAVSIIYYIQRTY